MRSADAYAAAAIARFRREVVEACDALECQLARSQEAWYDHRGISSAEGRWVNGHPSSPSRPLSEAVRGHL